MTSIGYGAFSACSGLTNVTIPDSVTSIGEGAFYECSNLTVVNIPLGVTSIGEWTFSGCTSLTSVTIPEGVTSIGNFTFSGCTNLTSIHIPGSVTSISDSAFSANIRLIADSCADYSFSWASSHGVSCDVLHHDWQDAVYTWTDNNMKVEARCVCANYAAHTVTETVDTVLTLQAPDDETPGSATYTAEFTEDAVSAQTKTVTIPALGELRVLRLPANLQEIDEEAFAGLNVQAVIIPDGCDTVGDRAFADCPNLLYIRIPAGVTSIAADAFEGSGQAVIDRAQ